MTTFNIRIEEDIKKFPKAIRSRCLTIREVAEEGGISKPRLMRFPLKIWAYIVLQPNMCRDC